MAKRKKVTSESITESSPKKRPTNPEPEKKPVIRPSDDKPSRWDKIEGVSGKVVRHKMSDKDAGIEMGNLIMKGKARRLYVGVDGNDMYFYFEIFREN